MGKRINLVPAYGRDYKSKSEIIVGLKAGNDFKIMDISNPYDGSYIDLNQIKEAGYEEVYVRYSKHTKITVIKSKELA